MPSFINPTTMKELMKAAYLAARSEFDMIPERREAAFEEWYASQNLSSLQSKGKTPTNEDIACEILARFHYTPHPNQRDKYNREKKAFADGAMWVRQAVMTHFQITP